MHRQSGNLVLFPWPWKVLLNVTSARQHYPELGSITQSWAVNILAAARLKSAFHCAAASPKNIKLSLKHPRKQTCLRLVLQYSFFDKVQMYAGVLHAFARCNGACLLAFLGSRAYGCLSQSLYPAGQAFRRHVAPLLVRLQFACRQGAVQVGRLVGGACSPVLAGPSPAWHWAGCCSPVWA